MNVSDMHIETQLIRKIDLSNRDAGQYKKDLADYLFENSTIEAAENIPTELEKMIEKAKTIVANEYTIEHTDPNDMRNTWLHVKNLVRVQLIAKLEPELMVEQKKGNQTVKVQAKTLADAGIKKAGQVAKSINAALGVSDGRSQTRTPRPEGNDKPKAPTQNAYSLDAWEKKFTAMSNSENKQLGAEFIQAMRNKWDFVQDIARKQGFTMTLLPIETESTAGKSRAKREKPAPQKRKPRLIHMKQVDAITIPPAKGKKHQPQPIRH